MGSLVHWLYNLPGLRLVTKPVTRVLVKLIAIPVFRFVLKYLLRVEVISQELEKDLTQWFRSSVLLLFATHNMEVLLFQTSTRVFQHDSPLDAVLFGLRLLLAIGCIEGMPDQELFRLIHPGPPRLQAKRVREVLATVRRDWKSWLWGIYCVHLSRSSPVFAIVTVFQTGVVGWVCYGFAIFQYLVIGLVTSRDRALDVLAQFDVEVALRRDELLSGLSPMPANYGQPSGLQDFVRPDPPESASGQSN